MTLQTAAERNLGPASLWGVGACKVASRNGRNSRVSGNPGGRDEGGSRKKPLDPQVLIPSPGQSSPPSPPTYHPHPQPGVFFS